VKNGYSLLLDIKAKILKVLVNSRKARDVCKYIPFFKFLDKEFPIDSILEFNVCTYIPLFKLLEKEFRIGSILEFNVFLHPL